MYLTSSKPQFPQVDATNKGQVASAQLVGGATWKKLWT